MTFEAKKLPKALWGSSFDRFIGPVHVSNVHEFDGRDEDNNIHSMADIGEPALWTSDDGDYAVHPVADPDWEPRFTVLLVHKDEIVGWYAEAMSWIDEAHRGKGLAPWMILSANIICGGVPYDNTVMTGFSEAGVAAHKAAWREGVRLAKQAGRHVPEKIVNEAIHLSWEKASAPSPRGP